MWREVGEPDKGTNLDDDNLGIPTGEVISSSPSVIGSFLTSLGEGGGDSGN